MINDDTLSPFWAWTANHPLLDPDWGTKLVDRGITTLPSTSAIYYGTGLTTAKKPSVGIPFDILGLLLLAEDARRQLGWDGPIIQLIADSHALWAGTTTPEEVNRLATMVQTTIQQVAERLGITNVLPLRASAFDHGPDYQQIIQRFAAEPNEYIQREWSDIIYLHEHFQLELKISWTVGGQPKPGGYDERLYDLRFAEVAPDYHMSFLYCKPGRTFDVDRQKVSPYITIEGENRLLLDPSTHVQQAFDRFLTEENRRKLNGTLQHLESIIQLYSRLIEPLPSEAPLDQRLQQILRRCFDQ